MVLWFNYTRLVVVITPTDCPKSVRNHCVIEVFGGVLCCHIHHCSFEFSVGVWTFGGGGGHWMIISYLGGY